MVRVLGQNYRRVTVSARQPLFPAASYARTVITVFPTYSGIVAAHCSVPAATPESPVDVVHRTCTTPVSSVAIPATATLASVVATTVVAGHMMRTDGAVRSVDGGVTGGDAGGGVGATGVAAGGDVGEGMG